jgi:hypothetical protein
VKLTSILNWIKSSIYSLPFMSGGGLACADEHLNKYEESIIRRVTDLPHIRHAEYIRYKLAARDQR